MAYDPVKDYRTGSRSAEVVPARTASAVAPSDTVDLPVYARALYIGVAGNVSVIPAANASDTPVVFTAHPVGYMPVAVRRVMATGTVASGILALG